MTDNPEIQQAENPAIQTSDNPEIQKAAKSTPAGRTPRGDAQVLLDTVVALLSTKTITAAAAKLGIDRGTVYCLTTIRFAGGDH
jgi:transcriptional regulator of acetoin/glycerol metabolism